MPIRLNRNEMPLPPSARVAAAACVAAEDLNRYTDEKTQKELAVRVAGYAGVPEERILLGPGSDMLIREAVHLFAPGRKVLAPCPAFLPTVQSARASSGKLVHIRLKSTDHSLPLELVTLEIDGPVLLVFDNPNNPTGNLLFSPAQVEELLKREDLLLVLDEAYFEFSGVTCMEMVEMYPNLLVTRSLDKVFGLAGARVGYAAAGDFFLEAMGASFSYLGRMSVAAAMAAMDETEEALRRVADVVRTRDRTAASLGEMGAKVFPSYGNYLLVRTRNPDMASDLADRDILVADVSSQMPPGFIRISIGTPREMDTFLSVWRELTL